MKKVLLLFMTTLMMSCSIDDVQERSSERQSYTLVYTTQNLEEYVTVYAGTKINYEDSSIEFINSEYDLVTNTVTIQTRPGPINIDSNFYIENGTEVSIILYDSEGAVITEQTITQVNYNFTYEF